jgi:hypothetical protein
MTAAYRRISGTPRQRMLGASEIDPADPRQIDLFSLTPDDYERPRTRGDCLPGGCNAERPCPWVSCRHNLYLDVQRSGAIRLCHPHLAPEQMEQSCALDIIDANDADRDAPQGCSLDVCAVAMNLSPEHIRALEALALASLREAFERDGFEADQPARVPAVVRVMRSVRRGHTTVRDIAEDSGLSLTATNWALSDLSELGEVERTVVGRSLRVRLVFDPQPVPEIGATNEEDANEDHR